MINFRRIPGVLVRYKTYFTLFFLLAVSAFYFMQRLGFVCTNHEINREIDSLCTLYKEGNAVGNLCSPLCTKKEIHSLSCVSQHSKKEFVFNAKWNKKLIVIKSSVTDDQSYFELNEPSSEFKKLKNSFKTRKTLSKIFARQSKKSSNTEQQKTQEADESIEVQFEKKIRSLVSERVNITLTQAQLEELKFLEVKNKLLYSEDSEQRKVERENVFYLLQSQEYLLSRLFSDRDIFPQIVGTCGHLYGVEYLERPKFNSMFTLDEKAEWSERMKLAVAIMEFVEEMETNFPDALHLCDVQMNHLGLTPSGRVKFLDLDLVYMKNVLDKILRSGHHCTDHKDCDLFDCKSSCNLKDQVCDSGVSNDNLQTICEKIFIGWTMSGKMIVPGLLMSEYTPASLSALLRLCAENRREPVPEDLRQRLYTTLTEMHQILIQKILSQ